jgi:hypothetical protein
MERGIKGVIPALLTKDDPGCGMKKSWWRSLRIKIIAWSFVPTLIILSAVAWFTFYSYQKVIGDLAIKQFPEITQPKAIAFSQAFNGLLNPIVVPIVFDIDTDHDLPIEARAQYCPDGRAGNGLAGDLCLAIDLHCCIEHRICPGGAVALSARRTVNQIRLVFSVVLPGR